MAVRWERLAGDTGVFAFKVGFADDPDDGQGIDREVGTSWGSFQIWIEGRNLCAHQEQDGHIDSVHWYLLPLIEWFARNWNPLLHEERLPVLNDGDTGWESLLSTRFPPPAIENDGERASASPGDRHAVPECRNTSASWSRYRESASCRRELSPSPCTMCCRVPAPTCCREFPSRLESKPSADRSAVCVRLMNRIGGSCGLPVRARTKKA